MNRIIPLIVLGAALLAACGGSPAPTGSAAPTQPAAPTLPVVPTQPPEATAAPATAAPATAAPATAAPATAMPTVPVEAAATAQPSKGEPQAPIGDPQGILAVFKRSGGIAGLNESMTIYEDGRIAFVGRDNENTAQVAPEELSELRRLLTTPEFAALNSRYAALGADLFIYSITTSAGGKPQTVVTMDGASNPPILDQVLAEMGKLMQAKNR